MTSSIPDILAYVSLKCLFITLPFILSYVVILELRRPRNLPPTPNNKRPLSFIGNILDIPTVRSWVKFREWNERYGPILTVWNGTVPMIVIGDPDIAIDLMEKRSSKYSSRPRFVVAGELCTKNKTLIFTPYGERWRAYRRAFHAGLMPKAVDTYLRVFEMEGKVLAADFLNDPQDWYQQLYRYTASSTVAVAYGRRINDVRTDKAYKMSTSRIEFITKMGLPGAQYHDLVPALQYIPTFWNSTKKQALHHYNLGLHNHAALVDEVRQKMKAGIAPHCLTKRMLEEKEKFNYLDDEEFNDPPALVFGAGVDTTSSTLQSFVLAMVLYPDVQKKAWKELDTTVGNKRSPTWEDENNLPFVCALIKEVLRWRPVTILGAIPHATIEDDYYVHDGKEYLIPKGSMIMGNTWAIHMNAKFYKNPEEFNPDRYLNGEVPPGSKGHSAFGWGRRACPGQYFAQRSLFLTISHLLWGFEFSKAKSDDGSGYITPDASIETGYTSGFNVRPYPFQCSIVPRSDAARDTIQKDVKEALEGLKEFET